MHIYQVRMDMIWLTGDGKQGKWGQKWVGQGPNTANVKFSTGNWNCDAYDRFFIGLPAALQVRKTFQKRNL